MVLGLKILPLLRRGEVSTQKSCVYCFENNWENVRDTNSINEDSNLVKQSVVRLHETLYSPTGPGLLPAMHRHPESGALRQTWDEGSENRELAEVPMRQAVDRGIDDRRTTEVG